MISGFHIFLILIVIIIIALVWIMSIYNHLVRSRNQYKNAFSQIDVQLTRRNDLIPNLIEVAKAYMKHESETLTAVIEARNQAVNAVKAANQKGVDANSIKELIAVEGALSSQMGGFFGLMEDYPDLKANQNMMQLTEELTSTENKIAFARQAYNDAVMHHNNSTESFPSNLVAGPFGFQQASSFLVEDDQDRKAQQIKF